MKSICYIDIGNTTINYAFGDQVFTVLNLLELEAVLVAEVVTDVFVSCVAGKSAELELICRTRGIVFYRAIVKNDVLGLALIYKDVSKLGVDRWLAMLCASGIYPKRNLLVIDAGTALKIDVINEATQHLGGSISPGLKLSFSALQQNTAQLPSASGEFSGQLGTDTVSCMRYGVVMSAVALIEKSLMALGGKYSVLLTGGDAPLLALHLEGSVEVIDNLVIGGLKRLHKDGYFLVKESA